MGREKRTGWTASLTEEERARVHRLLTYEDRTFTRQLLHMTDRRLAEIDRLERKNG